MRRGLVLLVAGVMYAGRPTVDGAWPAYGHDGGGTRHSPLQQITRANVAQLRPAWTYHVGDMFPGSDHSKQSSFETTPLYVDGTLYLSTAFGRVIALDPVRGTPRWTFDPHVDVQTGFGDFVNRGVSTWVEARTHPRRIFIATIDGRLIALDATTGRRRPDFGDGGEVTLRAGLRMPPQTAWEYEETSPPAIVDDLVIVGSGVADNVRADMASGEVRAFDARTGRLRWSWDPMPGTRVGAANAWSVISVDASRHLVFVPTGSASPDYFGGTRPGADLYADCIVALDAATGRLVWYFQTVHHDLWDYDVASQPVLITVHKDGRDVPAVAVGSKTGNLFLLDRASGAPLFGVEERPVPASDVPGEAASPTQPFPILPKPLVPQRVTAEDVWGKDSASLAWCRATISRLRSDGIFTPPSVGGSLLVPGHIGGMHWGSAAYDSARALLIIPTNRIPAVVRLIPQDSFDIERHAHPGPEYARQRGTPYGLSRGLLVAPSRSLCTKPPWGTLTAINVNTGAVTWQVPFGSLGLLSSDDARTGSINLGGLITTAGGLVFAAGSLDARLHAYDIDTGRELWAGTLPTSARAMPMTFLATDGRQYVVIAAGGHDVPGIPQGDALVAFALSNH
jgi:quinoprotein glucose dehydrogenase